MNTFILSHGYRVRVTRNAAFILLCISLSMAALNPRIFGQEQAQFTIPTYIGDLLKSSCFDCHDNDEAKGDIRLDNLNQLNLDGRLNLLNMVQEQVFTNQMPPKKKLQPSELEALTKWASTELANHKASTLEDKLRYYKYANYINHEKLFSGEIKDMPYTPARRWKINGFIYKDRVGILFGKKGFSPEKVSGIVEPFLQGSESGVKYYDTEVVQGGEFLTLLDNAKYIVNKQLTMALAKTDGYKPKYTDNFKPGRTEVEFEKIILANGSPSDADLQAAITRQFQLAFQRPPSQNELTQYLTFMKEAIKSNGSHAALEKMMLSVIMEAEFLYRSEFGDGQRDNYGRSKLTPREASYALAYALTDRIPDQALAEAAKAGKLATKEDYRREVIRMLDDDSLEKPRILRFFQDFFGYYNVFNIFKDESRFGGDYNPHRASSKQFNWRVPGKVTKEADALVLSILKEDKDVIKKLLTTDKFFVHHFGNNDEMVKQAAEISEITKLLKSEMGSQAKEKNDEKSRAQEISKKSSGKITGRTLQNLIALFDPANPDRKILPLFHDSQPHAVSMYNLDHKTWSYEAKQPIKVEHRMGMLTHPAWLVSFAKNAETDPIVRGKWIQEKLLAGIVPEVPITVEAQVPEAHDKTLRQRIDSVTADKKCWHCHQKMNPLGYPFESFDDFGRYRSDETLEHPENIIETTKIRGDKKKEIAQYKSRPVETSGALYGTGDKNLDGDVKDAFDLINRLGKSERVRQSFIRNVFRYFMGRNEMLSDSKTLIEADKAYVESGGSFKALMVSLLTSDSFIYRK